MIQFNFANVNGVKLHYASSGQGQPIIFLHGFPACWYVWKKQLERFGESFWAIAPDGRGVNLSSKPKRLEEYKIEVLASDVVCLADHLGIERFVLVGHDWGGTVAWQVAKVYPQRVSHLIVLNAPPLDIFLQALALLPEQRSASNYMGRLKASSAETILLAQNCALLWQVSFAEFLRKGIFKESDRAFYIQSWQSSGSLTGFLNWYRANIPDFDSINAVQSKPDHRNNLVPSLLLWGEQEKAFTRQLLELLINQIPDVDLVFIGADHWISLEQPDLFYQLTYDFIQRKS